MTGAEAIARVRPRVDALSAARWATPAILVALTALSLVLRTRVIDAGFWIDEGISVGIAHHPLADIPGLLRQDGSPPLYYLLLHVWIGWFGDGEVSTHVLSLAFALACIPAAYWAANELFGRLAGWICAGLAAIDPYLAAYGQETRMYTLLALLSIFAFPEAFLHNGAVDALEGVLENVTHRSAGTAGVDTLTSAADRAKVVRFLLSIDAKTAPIEP